MWYGDPLDAQLDLSAIYRLRAPFVQRDGGTERRLSKRVLVEVTMHLTDKLQNPGISYEVRLPTVDEDVRSRVNAVMSTPQDLNRQVFSLIVLNNSPHRRTRAPQGDGLAGTAIMPAPPRAVVEQSGEQLAVRSEQGRGTWA